MTRLDRVSAVSGNVIRLQHAASRRWLIWLRKLGLKPSSPNLIMVDFASRDPRSVSYWLDASHDRDQQSRQEVWHNLLTEPLLSDQDIRQYLGCKATSTTNASASESITGSSSC
jgi:hypothetical protein